MRYLAPTGRQKEACDRPSSTRPSGTDLLHRLVAISPPRTAFPARTGALGDWRLSQAFCIMYLNLSTLVEITETVVISLSRAPLDEFRRPIHSRATFDLIRRGHENTSNMTRVVVVTCSPFLEDADGRLAGPLKKDAMSPTTWTLVLSVKPFCTEPSRLVLVLAWLSLSDLFLPGVFRGKIPSLHVPSPPQKHMIQMAESWFEFWLLKNWVSRTVFQTEHHGDGRAVTADG